jgi:hypothetical protein
MVLDQKNIIKHSGVPKVKKTTCVVSVSTNFLVLRSVWQNYDEPHNNFKRCKFCQKGKNKCNSIM